MQALSRLMDAEAGAMMAPRWDVRQGPTVDSAGSHRLAPWSGLGGWLYVVLHVIANGVRSLSGNLLLEVCALLDRVGRIVVVGGAILSFIAARDNQWIIAGWAGLAAVGGLLAVGLASRALPD